MSSAITLPPDGGALFGTVWTKDRRGLVGVLELKRAQRFAGLLRLIEQSSNVGPLFFRQARPVASDYRLELSFELGRKLGWLSRALLHSRLLCSLRSRNHARDCRNGYAARKVASRQLAI